MESMLTFSTTWCSAKSATYFVLTHFHADAPSLEACFVHGCVPPGADPHGNIKEEGLVVDLRRRQDRRLAEGGDPHSKLPRLLDLPPTTGKFWFRPDMTAEHHAATIQHWGKRAPHSFRQATVPRGQAGSRTSFDTLAARAKQQWLFVEPCMREPLMVTPLESNSHPHFKPPPAQGWALKCYENEVADLRKNEAKRARYRRQRNGLDSERTEEVTLSLNVLFDGVTKAPAPG